MNHLHPFGFTPADRTFVSKLLTALSFVHKSQCSELVPWHLYCFDSISSTMDIAKCLLANNFDTAGFPPYDVVLPNLFSHDQQSHQPTPCIIVARAQTRGRGRLGREWFSTCDQGIYITFALFPRLGFGALNGFSLVAALAILKTITELGSPSNGRKIKIKWPNDVVCVQEGQPGYRKLAGILIESHSTGGSVLGLSVGIGLNVSGTTFPSGIDGTSLEEIFAVGQNYFRVFAKLTRQFISLSRNFFQQGFLPYRDLCWEHSLVQNKNVEVHINGKSQLFLVKGIDTQGGLRVVTEGGNEQIISSGEIECKYT